MQLKKYRRYGSVSRERVIKITLHEYKDMVETIVKNQYEIDKLQQEYKDLKNEYEALSTAFCAQNSYKIKDIIDAITGLFFIKKL